MKTNREFPVFDGHNDSLLRIYMPKEGEQHAFFERNIRGHMDLPRIKEGGFAGGFFSVFVPSRGSQDRHPGTAPDALETAYELPMPPVVDHAYAQQITIKGMATLFRLAAQSKGQIKVVLTADELDRSMRRGTLSVVLHLEGAESIDPDLEALHVFYQAGLRSLGIVWSRPNPFAEGVPFRFPHSPDTGPGLSEAGKYLIKNCNRLGIVIDLSHMNEKGFWDVEKLSDAPLVITHTGVNALCPSSRNVTDQQLNAVGASGGVVGVNFHVAFLRRDGRLDPDTPIMEIVRHIDYIAERIGIEHVAFGSDFDGATMPLELGDVSAMPKLIAVLRENGFDEAALRKLTHENWIRVLRKTWKD